MTRKLLKSLFGVMATVALLFAFQGSASADSVDGSSNYAVQVRANDGNYYDCLEYDEDQGCRTGVIHFDEEFGSITELWIAPSGRPYWQDASGGKGAYRYVPPPEGEGESGPLVQPVPQPPAQEPIVYDPYGFKDPSQCGGE